MTGVTKPRKRKPEQATHSSPTVLRETLQWHKSLLTAKAVEYVKQQGGFAAEDQGLKSEQRLQAQLAVIDGLTGL